MQTPGSPLTQEGSPTFLAKALRAILALVAGLALTAMTIYLAYVGAYLMEKVL